MPHDDDRRFPEDRRLARLIAHPLRHRLLWEYASQVTSPSRIAAVLGERVNVVSYHTNVLLQAGLLDLVRTERRRGATEHFYRSHVLGAIEDDDWSRLPVPARRMAVRRVLDVIVRDLGDAVPLGGMDDPTMHVSRTFLTLDDPGRAELAAVLRTTIETAQRIEEQSCRRRDGPVHRSEMIVLRFEAPDMSSRP
jgi:DNA-binding transcriptional ArsR family regulator